MQWFRQYKFTLKKKKTVNVFENIPPLNADNLHLFN